MPFMNGVGFLYRLRADAALQRIPVMVVTGVSVSDQQVSELGELNAVVRQKPLDVEQLLAETRSLLDPDCQPSRQDVPAAAVTPR
jgi:DNA-binding response OmpR family regulator